MADPGFPRGGANLRGGGENILFGMKMKNKIGRGGASLATPLGPPVKYISIIKHMVFKHIETRHSDTGMISIQTD